MNSVLMNALIALVVLGLPLMIALFSMRKANRLKYIPLAEKLGAEYRPKFLGVFPLLLVTYAGRSFVIFTRGGESEAQTVVFYKLTNVNNLQSAETDINHPLIDNYIEETGQEVSFSSGAGRLGLTLKATLEDRKEMEKLLSLFCKVITSRKY